MIWALVIVAWVALTVGFVLGCRWVGVCRRWDAEMPTLRSGHLAVPPRTDPLRTAADF